MIPSLNYAVITEALHALQQGNFSSCKAMGFTFDELNALAQLSLDELFLISQSSAQLMTITVSHDALKQLLVLCRQEAQRLQKINRAIRLGGSIALLSHFFGLTSNEVCNRRRLLGVAVSQGRTRLPNEAIDSEIWQLWQKNRPDNIESPDALDVMMQVTEALSSRAEAPSLTVVWNRIRLCEKEKQDRSGSHAR